MTNQQLTQLVSTSSTDVTNETTLGIENNAVETAQEVLSRLVSVYDPDYVYAAVSGGDDSTAALDFAATSDHVSLDAIIHLDTGIGIPETTEFVAEQAEKYGLEFICLGDHNARFNHERYDHLVKQFGFPGANPIAHQQHWKNLKEKILSRFLASHDGTVAIISGVRKYESENRWEEIPDNGVEEKSNAVWASPLMEFTDEALATYRDARDLDENPVAALLCASGECLCGSFADRRKLPMIADLYPEVVKDIYQLEFAVLDRVARGEVKKEFALWAHGSVDKGEYEARTDSQQTTFNFCSSCEEDCPKPYDMDESETALSPAEAFLKTHSLHEYWDHPFYCAVCDLVVDDPYGHRLDVHPFDAEVDDAALESQWDMRKLDIPASDKAGIPITEPNGWFLDTGQLTTDSNKAARSKHVYHYDEVAITLCEPGAHEWQPYNGGPVNRCENCFAFNLAEYDHSSPGPPITDAETDSTATTLRTALDTGQSEAATVHRTLASFGGGNSSE